MSAKRQAISLLDAVARLRTAYPTLAGVERQATTLEQSRTDTTRTGVRYAALRSRVVRSRWAIAFACAVGPGLMWWGWRSGGYTGLPVNIIGQILGDLITMGIVLPTRSSGPGKHRGSHKTPSKTTQPGSKARTGEIQRSPDSARPGVTRPLTTSPHSPARCGRTTHTRGHKPDGERWARKRDKTNAATH
jgi:hypothetical protein